MDSLIPGCTCICGNGKKGEIDIEPFTRSQPLGCDIPELSDVPDDLPGSLGPSHTGVLAYNTSPDQPLCGIPVREGDLWLLSTENDVAEKVCVSLHINGFRFLYRGQEHSFLLSPFSLVRTCRFQSGIADSLNLSDVKCFKVSLFTHGACFYFGVRGSFDPGATPARGNVPDGEDDEEDERSLWVTDIARAVRAVTQSLFPPFRVVCDPLRAVPRTSTRLMAGYLLHHADAGLAAVLYCELHPQSRDTSKLSVYENESCQVLIVDLIIDVRTTCCEKVGVSCSSFFIEDHLFCARSLLERKLWLRAIANVKVKLQHRAPSPTREELRAYRHAIKEYMATSKEGRDALHCQSSAEALLQRQPFGAPQRQSLCTLSTEVRCPPRYTGPCEPTALGVPEALQDEGFPPVADELCAPEKVEAAAVPEAGIPAAPSDIAHSLATGWLDERGGSVESLAFGAGEHPSLSPAASSQASSFVGLFSPISQPDEHVTAASAPEEGEAEDEDQQQEVRPPCTAEEPRDNVSGSVEVPVARAG